MDCITGQFSHQTWVKKMSTNAEISTKQSSQNLGRLSYTREQTSSWPSHFYRAGTR